MDDFTAPLIDIGANLTSGQFKRDLPQVLRRAQEAGLQSILLTGTSMAASRDAIALVKQQQSHTQIKLFSTVGVHPHDAKSFDEVATLQQMREMIQQNPGIVCAVGECGLDFNRDFSPRDKQERVFRAQVQLACELRLPLFLHERDAHETFVNVFTPFVEAGSLPPVVVHCFTGTEAHMRKYLSMGFYIGLTGFVCMDSRGFKLRTMASQIPLDKLLIETDAPYMYPYGNNTRARCEPKDLRAVVHTLASCFHESSDTIAAATTRNARTFFALDKCEALRPSANTNGHAAAHSTTHSAAHAASSVQHHKNHAHHKKSDKQPTADHAKPVGAQAHVQAQPRAAEAIAMATHDAIALDGGNGEGGGQVIRIAMGLASVLKKKIHIGSIRANRKIPGLRNQHVRTVQLAQQLSNGQLDGASIGSSQVVFDAQRGHLLGGHFQAHSETGGSVSLMIQGSLPAMLLASQPTTLALRGGTHVSFSPPTDFMELPLTELLGRMGANIKLETIKRGFFPGGQGEITFSAQPLEKPLQPIILTDFSSEIVKISTRVTVYGEHATEEVGQEFVAALKRAFKKRAVGSSDTQFVWEIIPEVATAASSKGAFRRHKRNEKEPKDGKPSRSQVSILTVLESSSGGLITVDRTEKDTPEYAALKIMDVVARHLDNEVCVDEHLADNAVVYMALARGVSQLRVPCKANRSSQHLETALELVAQLTGATYELVENEKNAVVTVHGVGHVRE